MSTFNGLPAHALLVHFIVVLAPLTALLAILCAVWPAARERLVWLVLTLAAVTVVLTPLTTEAGEWLEHRVGETPALETHADLGDTMIFFSIGLLVATLLLAFAHVRARRDSSNAVIGAVISLVVIVLSAATIVQVYRIGDSGAKSVWGGVTQTQPASPDDDD
ncbi:DUF2231 domain-containing protein [Mycolicibacterium palauense]|uniref:DUF2231 domain-containing protein n=1 Tax=Mycolicibacterium palauense TaxID=2034511 RepID=UPI000BFED360|nr:DUF2231 domain-containing protein [Mycolicibacterium palauense]